MNSYRYLESVCDVQVNYVGCQPELKKKMLEVDLVFICLHFLSAFLYLIPIVKIKIIKGKWTLMNSCGLVLMASQLIRAGFFLNQRNILKSDGFDLDQLTRVVRGSIYLNSVYITLAGAGANLFVMAFVRVICETNLYEPFTFRGKMVDPAHTLAKIRVLVAILNLTFASLWAFNAFSLDSFIFYRRLSYFFIGFLSFFVTGPNLAFFGGKVIKAISLKFELSHRSLKKISTTPNSNNLKSPNPDTGSSIPASPGALIPITSTNESSLNAMQKLKSLKRTIYSVLVTFYLLGCSKIMVTLANELFQENPSMLLTCKIIYDSYIWFSNGWFSLYLLMRK